MKHWNGSRGILSSMKEDRAQVIIPSGLTNPPEPHEISAAWILARHYNTIVEFLRPIKGSEKTTISKNYLRCKR
jgi:hypothetical protein